MPPISGSFSPPGDDARGAPQIWTVTAKSAASDLGLMIALWSV